MPQCPIAGVANVAKFLIFKKFNNRFGSGRWVKDLWVGSGHECRLHAAGGDEARSKRSETRFRRGRYFDDRSTQLVTASTMLRRRPVSLSPGRV